MSKQLYVLSEQRDGKIRAGLYKFIKSDYVEIVA